MFVSYERVFEKGEGGDTGGGEHDSTIAALLMIAPSMDLLADLSSQSHSRTLRCRWVLLLAFPKTTPLCMHALLLGIVSCVSKTTELCILVLVRFSWARRYESVPEIEDKRYIPAVRIKI